MPLMIPARLNIGDWVRKEIGSEYVQLRPNTKRFPSAAPEVLKTHFGCDSTKLEDERKFFWIYDLLGTAPGGAEIKYKY